MSRIANSPVSILDGVDVAIKNRNVSVKGKLGQLDFTIHDLVSLEQTDSEIQVKYNYDNLKSRALAGTTRALVNNMILGVSKGFEKKLQMVGVGYRAKVQGSDLHITAGFSHPVVVTMPEGIKVETPAPTEIIIKGINKQLVGETAAKIRALRPPEPYKGKGIRYVNEHVSLKEGKKK